MQRVISIILENSTKQGNKGTELIQDTSFVADFSGWLHL